MVLRLLRLNDFLFGMTNSFKLEEIRIRRAEIYSSGSDCDAELNFRLNLCNPASACFDAIFVPVAYEEGRRAGWWLL